MIDAVSSFAASVRVCCAVGEAVWAVTTQNALLVYHPTSFYSATAVELDIRGSGATCLVGLVQCMLAVPTRYTRHTKGSSSSRRSNDGEDERGDMTLWLGTSAGELLYISDVGRISDQLTSAVSKQSTTLSATRTPPLARKDISENGYGNNSNNNNDNMCEVMPTRLYRRRGRYVVKATMLPRLPSEARPSAIVSMDYAGPFRRSSSSASPQQRFCMRRGGEERGVADVDAGTSNTDGHTNTVHSYSYSYDKDKDSRRRAEEALVWVAIGCACGVVVLLDNNNNADEAIQPVVRLVRHLRAPCAALRFLSHRGPPLLAAGDAEGGVYLWDFTSVTFTAGRKGTSLVPVSCIAGATSSCASASSCAAARSLPHNNNASNISRSAPLSRPVKDASTHSSTNNNSVDACGADQDGPPLLLCHYRDDDITTTRNSSSSKGVDQLLYHAGTLWVARRNTQIDLYALHRTYATTNRTEADMERLLESDQWPVTLTLALQYRIEARARVTALLALPPRTVLVRTASGRLIAFDAKTFAVVRRVPCAAAATAVDVDDDDVEGGAEKEKCARRNTSSNVGGGSGALVVVRQTRTFEVWSCAPQHGAVKVWRVTSAVEGDGHHDNPSCYHHDDCDDNYYYCWRSDDGSYRWPGREAWRWASLRQSVASQSGAQGKSEAEGECDTLGQRESATSPHTMMMKKTATDDKDGNSSSNDPCHTKAQVGDGMTRREEAVYNTTTNSKQQEGGEDWFTYAAARDAAWHASAESLRRSRDEAQELRLRLLRGQAEDAAVQEELRQRTHHNAELQRQLSSLTQKLTEMTSQVAIVEKDRVALQQEMTQVKNELAQARREASEALASRTLAEREAARHAADSALLTRRVEEASREVTSLRTEQTTLLHRLAQKEQQQQLLLRDQHQAQPTTLTTTTTVTGDKSAGEDRLQHALAEATQRQQMLSDALSSALYTIRRLELEHDDLAALLQAYQDKLRCALQSSRASVIHTSAVETPLTALLLATMVRHPARFELGGVDAATKEALLDRHGPFLQFLHRLHRDDGASYARLMRTLQSAGQSTSQETKAANENEEQEQKREEEKVNVAAAAKTNAGCTTQETWQECLRQMMACEGVHGLAGQNATLQMLWNAVNGVSMTTTGSQEGNANTNNSSSGPNNDTSHISPPPTAAATTTTTTTNVSGGGVAVTTDGAGTHNECPATCGAAAMTASFSLQRGLPSLLTTRPPPSASLAAQGIATMGPGSPSASAPPPLACVQPGMTITAPSNTHNAQASLITTSSSSGGGNNNNNNTNNVVDNNTKNGTSVSAGTSAAATTTTTISTGGLSSTANATTSTREAALLRPAVGPSSPSPSSATTNTIITAAAAPGNNNNNNSGITGTMNNGTGDANASGGVSRMPALPSTASCLPPAVQTSDSSFLAAAGPAAAVTNNNNINDSVSKGAPSEPGRLGEASRAQLVLGPTEGNRTDNNNTTYKNSSNNEPRSDTTRPTTTTTTTTTDVVVSYADVEAELGRLREVYRTFEFVLATRPGLVERLAQLYEHLRRAQGAVATFAALHPVPDADSSSSRYDGSHWDAYACYRRTNMNQAPYHTTSSSSSYPVHSGRRGNAMSSFTTTTTNAPPSQTHYHLMDDTLRASDGVVRAMLCDTLTELTEMFSVLITGYLTDAEKQRLQL